MVVVGKKKETKTKPKGPWKALGIVSTDAEDMAKRMERALNSLEAEGFQARDPIQYGAHIIVYGRWPYVDVKEADA
jgi:hypothetical protein